MKDRKTVLWLLGAMILSLALIAGCGDDDSSTPPGDDTTTATIGTAGGEISRTGEVTLTVPAGALPGNVDFTVDENTSPTALPTDREGLTPAFSIGPDGTTFGSAAEIKLYYDEGDLNGADESDIVIYTDDGSGWTALSTTVDEASNVATADVNHLSDYIATVPYEAEGVYALLEILREVTYIGSTTNIDFISARFDTVVDPCSVHHALHPDSLFCNDYELLWDTPTTSYIDDSETADFLVPGDTYTYTIHGNAEVPDLTQSIDMPTECPYVTNISQMQVLSKDGFTVEWADTGAGTVWLGLIPDGSDDPVTLETANDGSYTFTAADLADLEPGDCTLNLIHYTSTAITATGYDPNSLISAGSQHVILVTLSNGGAIGTDGGTVALGDDGYLEIPELALSTEIEFTAEINTSPTAAPDGWAFVTPVYTVGPSGTTFAVDAELAFYYDTSLVTGFNDDYDVETITIFTDEGSGWTALDSDVYEMLTEVDADVSHLSDFAAMIEVPQVGEGVYCEIEVVRTLWYIFGTLARGDEYEIRFDAIVDPEPDTPLDADGVTVGTLAMEWDSSDQQYAHDALPSELLDLDTAYNVVVDGDADVPDLTQSIQFVDAEPYITSFETNTDVPTTGFDIEWAGTNDSDVHLVITTPNPVTHEPQEIINTYTPNDGLFTVSESDLSTSPLGVLLIELTYENEGTITATGYNPASKWEVYTLSLASLTLVAPTQ